MILTFHEPPQAREHGIPNYLIPIVYSPEKLRKNIKKLGMAELKRYKGKLKLSV